MILREIAQRKPVDVKSKLVKYIDDWLESSDDPDFEPISKKSIASQTKSVFKDTLTPQQINAVAGFIFYWTSSGETEKSAPFGDEIRQWVVQHIK